MSINHSRQPDATEIPAGTAWLFYARDSGNARQAASCDQQLTVGKQVLERAGAHLAREPYVDRARKGSTTIGRAELERLLVEAQPGAAYGVLFWSSARMARDVDDAQYIRSTLRRRGYALYYISDNIGNMGEWTPLYEVVQDISNAKRLKEISAEAKRGHDLAIAAGLIPCGMPPIGYKLESVVYRVDRDGRERTAPRWVIDPETAPRVRQAFQMRLEGYGLLAINQACRLFADGRHVGRLLRCTTYRGDVTFGQRLLVDAVEPLVSREDWERVQAVAQARRAKHPRELAARYLLAGLAYCGLCGERMGGHLGHAKVPRRDGGQREYTYHHYRCTSIYQPGGGCGALMLRAEWAEARVLEAVQATYLDEGRLQAHYAEWQRAMAGTDETATQIETLAAEVADLERRVARLLDEIERGSSVGDRLALRESELAAKRVALARLQAQPVMRLAPPTQAAAMLDKVQAAIVAGDRETARLFLAKLVTRIELKKNAAPVVTLRAPVLA